MRRKFVAVLNSLVFVHDSSLEFNPDIDGMQPVWSSRTGVAISCLPDSDGETEIIVAEADPEPGAGLVCVFEGSIETPSGALVVEVLPHIRLFSIPAPSSKIVIRIWTDGFMDTRMVMIVIQ